MRATGNKIVILNCGPFTGKVMKHVSKQGRVYVMVTTEVQDESLKCWYGKDLQSDEEADNPSAGSHDDESLMVSLIALKSERESEVTEPAKKKVIVNEDQNEVSVNTTRGGCLSQSSFDTQSKPKRESQVTVGYNTYVNMFPDDDVVVMLLFSLNFS